MSDYQMVMRALARDDAQLEAFCQRINELAKRDSIADARKQATLEFKEKALALMPRPEPPAPKPQKKKKPPVVVESVPSVPSVPEPPRQVFNPVADLEFVYMTCRLKGEALEQARKAAPSGGAVAMLDQFLEDAPFRTYFFNQLLPRYLLTRDRMDSTMKKAVTSRPILELIRKTLRLARQDAGLDMDDDEAQDDADTDESLAPAGAEDAG